MRRKFDTVAVIVGVVALVAGCGVFFYRNYVEKEHCNGMLIRNRELLAYLEHIQGGGTGPVFYFGTFIGGDFSVVNDRGEWGGAKSEWRDAMAWVKAVAECEDQTTWREMGIFPDTMPPKELLDFEYGYYNKPSRELVETLNGYLEEITDEVDWSTHVLDPR